MKPAEIRDGVLVHKPLTTRWQRWKRYELVHGTWLIKFAMYVGFSFTFGTLAILQWDRKRRANELTFDLDKRDENTGVPLFLYYYLVSHTYHDTWHGRAI